MKIFSTPFLLAVASANVSRHRLRAHKKSSKVGKTVAVAPSSEPSEEPTLKPTISGAPSNNPSQIYQLVGQGNCVNVSSEQYKYSLVIFSGLLDNCASVCKFCEIGLSGESFRGFQYDPQASSCKCLFDDGLAYSGECFDSVNSDGTATGPITGALPDAIFATRSCYSFN